jgi:hypothetical protein
MLLRVYPEGQFSILNMREVKIRNSHELEECRAGRHAGAIVLLSVWAATTLQEKYGDPDPTRIDLQQFLRSEACVPSFDAIRIAALSKVRFPSPFAIQARCFGTSSSSSATIPTLTLLSKKSIIKTSPEVSVSSVSVRMRRTLRNTEGAAARFEPLSQLDRSRRSVPQIPAERGRRYVSAASPAAAGHLSNHALSSYDRLRENSTAGSATNLGGLLRI